MMKSRLEVCLRSMRSWCLVLSAVSLDAMTMRSFSSTTISIFPDNCCTALCSVCMKAQSTFSLSAFTISCPSSSSRTFWHSLERLIMEASNSIILDLLCSRCSCRCCRITSITSIEQTVIVLVSVSCVASATALPFLSALSCISRSSLSRSVLRCNSCTRVRSARVHCTASASNSRALSKSAWFVQLSRTGRKSAPYLTAITSSSRVWLSAMLCPSPSVRLIFAIDRSIRRCTLVTAPERHTLSGLYLSPRSSTVSAPTSSSSASSMHCFSRSPNRFTTSYLNLSKMRS
mmetsp:Transcript_1080/g.2133  ORF Transcript_1080/g.2133 Transcript_1080/m.2133 type:complete len:289 (-) Transcript_1080:697-1563(-)